MFKAEALIAQGYANKALPLLAATPPAGEAFQELRARRLLHLGYARFLQGEYTEARRLLEEGLLVAPDIAKSSVTAELEMRHAAVLARLSDIAGAQQCLRRARDIAVRREDAYLEASAVGNVGFILMAAARYDEAVPWFEQAMRLGEQAGARRVVSAITGNLGRCYYSLGDTDRALQFLQRAATAAARDGDAYRNGVWLGALGDAYYNLGDFSRAVEHYRRALTLASGLGDRGSAVTWRDALCRSFLEAGDLATATRYDDENLRQTAGWPEMHAWAVLRRARILAAKKEYGAAEQAFQQVLASTSDARGRDAHWAARAGLADLLAQSDHWPAAEHEYEAALDELERTRLQMARDEWKLTFAASVRRFYEDYVDHLMDRGQTDRALEIAESARAQVLAQKLAGTAPQPGTSAHFREVARRSGAVLVSYWLSRRRSFAWVVRPGRIEWFALPPQAALETLVRAYRTAIEGLRDPLETANPAGRQLADILLGPLRGRVPKSGRVVLVPDGGLNELNFEALPAGAHKYWIEDVTVAISPSLSLLEPRRWPLAGASASLLLIGDPLPAAPEYPALPDARQEVESIGGRFRKKSLLTGAAAFPEAYRAAGPAQFSFIHFSAHATANRESPLDSAVILSRKGESWKLYAREVVGIPLRARLVTISACRGAGARWYAGEGLVGFTWAFLQAGARNVIAGLWDVNDRSTAELMQRVYAGLTSGRGAATALRQAKLALLHSAGPWRKPYYWAPFQLFTRACDF